MFILRPNFYKLLNLGPWHDISAITRSFRSIADQHILSNSISVSNLRYRRVINKIKHFGCIGITDITFSRNVSYSKKRSRNSFSTVKCCYNAVKYGKI